MPVNVTSPPAGAGGGRAAVVAPGRFYGADAPLLMFAALAVEQRGGLVHRISWAVPANAADEAERIWVPEQVGEAVDAISAAADVAAPAVIGKSLGTLAAPLASSRGLPAVWLTPLLTDEPTLTALRQATAPCLLIGGTADEVWDGELARSVTPHVLEIDGADHGMFVAGRLARSADVLGQVVTAVENFLDQQVWPRAAASGST